MQPAVDSLGVKPSRIVVALDQVAAAIGQEVKRRGIFDAFGHDAQSQASAEAHDGGQIGTRALVGGGRKRAIDLDLVDGR